MNLIVLFIYVTRIWFNAYEVFEGCGLLSDRRSSVLDLFLYWALSEKCWVTGIQKVNILSTYDSEGQTLLNWPIFPFTITVFHVDEVFGCFGVYV